MKKVKMLMILTAVFLIALPTSVFAGGKSEAGSAPAQSSGPIIVGSNSAPRTLNPLFFPSRQDSIVTNLIFDNFVEPDKNGIIVGALAE